MPGIETEHVFEGSIDRVFRAIIAYEKYPKYIPLVNHVERKPAQVAGSSCVAHYDVNIIKKFYYELNMFEEENKKVSWELAESNMLSKSNGLWQLSEHSAGQTHAIYKVEIAVKKLVPKMVVNKLTQTALPATLKGFQDLINETQ